MRGILEFDVARTIEPRILAVAGDLLHSLPPQAFAGEDVERRWCLTGLIDHSRLPQLFGIIEAKVGEDVPAPAVAGSFLLSFRFFIEMSRSTKMVRATRSVQRTSLNSSTVSPACRLIALNVPGFRSRPA